MTRHSQERRDGSSLACCFFPLKRKGKNCRLVGLKGKEIFVRHTSQFWRFCVFDFMILPYDISSAISLSKAIAFSFISGDTSHYVCISSISKESWRDENGVVYIVTLPGLSYSFLFFPLVLQVCTSSPGDPLICHISPVLKTQNRLKLCILVLPILYLSCPPPFNNILFY